MPRLSTHANFCRRSAQAIFAGFVMNGLLGAYTFAQTGADVTIHIMVSAANGKPLAPSASAPVVVWLSRIGVNGETDLKAKPGIGRSFQMVQKDKTFVPHLLVVPTGSLVAFPNRDPFFHNVFSLFNGRRFDLGLYQTGATRSVPLNREGVSYIFCNIHPEMGAVIVSIATPYFAVSAHNSVQVHQVPPGDYLLKVWAEDASAASLEKASRPVKVGKVNNDAGAVNIMLQPRQPHPDKYNSAYSQHPEASPY